VITAGCDSCRVRGVPLCGGGRPLGAGKARTRGQQRAGVRFDVLGDACVGYRNPGEMRHGMRPQPGPAETVPTPIDSDLDGPLLTVADLATYLILVVYLPVMRRG
jgi:hypothetical protein